MVRKPCSGGAFGFQAAGSRRLFGAREQAGNKHFSKHGNVVLMEALM